MNKMVEVTSRKFGFTLFRPAGWSATVSDNDTMTVWLMSDYGQPPPRLNVYISAFSGLRTMQDFVDFAKKPEEHLIGKRMIKQQDFTLKDLRASKVVCCGFWRGVGHMLKVSYGVFTATTTFVITCTAVAGDSESLGDAETFFDQIVSSFRILESEKRTAMASADVTAGCSPLDAYNEGIRCFERRQFETALGFFERCFQSGEYRMQSAYAIARSIREEVV